MSQAIAGAEPRCAERALRSPHRGRRSLHLELAREFLLVGVFMVFDAGEQTQHILVSDDGGNVFPSPPSGPAACST